MNRLLIAALVACSALAAGCNEPRADAADEARKTAATLTGDDKMAAADNPQCKLFDATELQAYVGESLEAGTNAVMGTGCQWPATDDSGDVMVIVIPPDYHTPPTLADGYRELADVGTKGYVVPEMGGWAAGAIVGADAVKVSVAGEKASADMAVALLKEAIKRRGG